MRHIGIGRRLAAMLGAWEVAAVMSDPMASYLYWEAMAAASEETPVTPRRARRDGAVPAGGGAAAPGSRLWRRAEP
jgi:hypothetical protein